MFRTPQVVLFSADVPRAVAFYTRLGFTEAFRVPTDGEPIHVDLMLDGYRIGIASVNSTRDAPALAAPHPWLDRLLIAWTADPDGNPIQIVQHL